MYPYTVIINQTTQRLRLTNNLRLCLISVSKKAENLYIDRIDRYIAKYCKAHIYMDF